MDFNLFLLLLPLGLLIGYFILDLRGEQLLSIFVVLFVVYFFSGMTFGNPFELINATLSSWNVTEDNQIQNVPMQDSPVQETPVIVPEKIEKPLNETWNNDWIHRT